MKLVRYRSSFWKLLVQDTETCKFHHLKKYLMFLNLTGLDLKFGHKYKNCIIDTINRLGRKSNNKGKPKVFHL